MSPRTLSSLFLSEARPHRCLGQWCARKTALVVARSYCGGRPSRASVTARTLPHRLASKCHFWLCWDLLFPRRFLRMQAPKFICCKTTGKNKKQSRDLRSCKSKPDWLFFLIVILLVHLSALCVCGHRLKRLNQYWLLSRLCRAFFACTTASGLRLLSRLRKFCLTSHYFFYFVELSGCNKRFVEN